MPDKILGCAGLGAEMLPALLFLVIPVEGVLNSRVQMIERLFGSHRDRSREVAALRSACFEDINTAGIVQRD